MAHRRPVGDGFVRCDGYARRMNVGGKEETRWGWDEPVTEATLELPRPDAEVSRRESARSRVAERLGRVASRLPSRPSGSAVGPAVEAATARLRAVGSRFLESRRAQLAVAGALALLLVVLVSTGGGEPTATKPKRAVHSAAPASPELPVPPAAALPLREGDRGRAVGVLQQALARLGYGIGKPDGFFGDRTKHAVELFQTASRLSADGIVGQRTAQMLRVALAKASD
jgi:hypothetical protein